MKALRTIVFVIISLPVLAVLFWFVAIPGDVLQKKIEGAVADAGNSALGLNIEGFQKGLFFSLSADSLDLTIDNRPALTITDFRGHYTPRFLTSGQLGFALRARIGHGSVNGNITLPLHGSIRIHEADLGAVPYLTQFNMKIDGSVSSDIALDNGVVDVTFDVPDLHIDDSSSIIPLLNTFTKLQGSLSVKGGTITIESVSMEGGKGYARLKGTITNRIMHLVLELMPLSEKLSTMESMIIGKYVVSPGYYVVPINGPLP